MLLLSIFSISIPASAESTRTGQGYTKGKALSVAEMRAKNSCSYKEKLKIEEYFFEKTFDNGDTKRWEATVIYDCVKN